MKAEIRKVCGGEACEAAIGGDSSSNENVTTATIEADPRQPQGRRSRC